MKRGNIYYIHKRPTTGSEIAGARPAVIVSNDVLNATSDVVMVVYLTTKPKKAMPTHATITATGVMSTAICEHIDHVSTDLIGDYCGSCTEEEMAAIDAAMLSALGIEVEEAPVCRIGPEGAEIRLPQNADLIKVTAERDTYKELVDKMLRQGVCGV